MKTKVSERGQITIPKKVRERLGIRPGQVLEVLTESGRLIATKAAPEEGVDAVYGILEADATTNELIIALRGEPDGL